MAEQVVLIQGDGSLLTQPIQSDPIAEVADAIYESAQAAIDFAQDVTGRVIDSARRHSSLISRVALVTALSVGAAGVAEHTPESALFKVNKAKAAAVTVGLGGAGALGYWAVEKITGWNGPNIHVNISPAKPAEAVAGIDQESYKVEQDLSLICAALVSVGVRVHSHKENGFLEANADVKKFIFGDFLLCGNPGVDGKPESTTPETITTTLTVIRDKKTGNVLSVTGFYPQLEPTHARVNFLDERNCLNTNDKTTLDKVNELLAKRQADIAAGKHPGCDDGFDTSNWWEGAPNDSTKTISLGYTAAQIAIAIDTEPDGIIADETAKFNKLVRDTILGEYTQYGLTDANLHLSQQVVSDDETLQGRLLALKPSLDARFTSVELVQSSDDGTLQLVAKGADGEKVTVNFTGSLDIKDIAAANAILSQDTRIVSTAPDATTTTVQG